MQTDRQGSALTAVIIGAVILSIAAVAVLSMSTTRVSTSSLDVRRLRARYAAEAGTVWAMQQLWGNSNWSDPSGDVDLKLDTDGNGSTDTSVDVIMNQCKSVPCESRRLQAKVVY